MIFGAKFLTPKTPRETPMAYRMTFVNQKGVWYFLFVNIFIYPIKSKIYSKIFSKYFADSIF